MPDDDGIRIRTFLPFVNDVLRQRKNFGAADEFHKFVYDFLDKITSCFKMGQHLRGRSPIFKAAFSDADLRPCGLLTLLNCFAVQIAAIRAQIYFVAPYDIAVYLGVLIPRDAAAVIDVHTLKDFHRL